MRKRDRWILGGLLAGLAVLVGGLALGGAFAWNPGDGIDRGQRLEAIRQCEGFAERRLVSPASAEYDLDAQPLGPNRWQVTGYVDSANSFGALLRNELECVVVIGEDVATLESISLG